VVKSLFRKPGEDNDSADEATDDVEEIPRTEVGELSAMDIAIKEDFVLFIKMTPYPLTLEEFIVSKSSNRDLWIVRADCYSGLTYRPPTKT
jgi:translation initiation factor 2-alpha kinase 3